MGHLQSELTDSITQSQIIIFVGGPLPRMSVSLRDNKCHTYFLLPICNYVMPQVIT